MKRAMQIIAIVLLSIMGLGFMGIVLKALMNDSPSEPSDSSFVSDSTSEPPDSSFVSDSMSESSDSSSTEEYPNLAFTLLNDDTYSVSAANTKIVTAEIPARYRGKTVTNIATNGFNACKVLTTVKIPASIKYISWQAFKDCVNLTTLEFPVEGEIKISSFAFASIGIQELILPGSVSEIDAQAFANCVKLELLEIKSSKTALKNSFYSCRALRTVTLAAGMTNIPSQLFMNCIELSEIEIPETVTYIGESAFANTAIVNHQADGVVYIGEWAVGVKGYLQDDEIDRLTIKEGTKKIGGLLYNYTKLRSIVIPSSIELICTGAFSGCSGLTTVYNLSSLPIEAGSESYGGVARYAENVYTELPTE